MSEVGPLGGNLNSDYNPAKPEWRKTHLNVDTLPGGGMSLHRFVKDQDTSTPGRKNEQPWHRMAAFMINAGRTNSEIAMAANVATVTVSHLKAQRWFQELCATIANADGEDIVGLIKSEVAASIAKVVELRDNSESDRIQLSASQILIEQGQGKPVQKNVSIVSHSRLSPEDEMTELTAELETLRKLSPVPALLPDAERKT